MPSPPTRQASTASIFLRGSALLLLLPLTLPAAGQYPGHTQADQKKTAKALRAISVLEWIGAPGKPVASRIVPVSVYVDGEYQDGGLYLAQPAPLTVQTDTLYELEKAGVPQGTFYIAGGEDVGGSWFGYGQWKPLAAPKPVKKLPPSKNPPRVVEDNDPDRPQFKGQSGSKGSNSSGGSTGTQNPSAPAADPDKPSLHRRTDDGSSSSGASSGNTSGGNSTGTAPDDPDQPTLHRRSDTDTSGSSANAPDDPDRPHLSKHSDTTSATGAPGSPVSSVNEADPDRPKMFRGEPPVSQKQLEATKLTGMPADLQQMAAVSDPAVREEHPFDYQWANPDDAAKMKAAVEALAAKAVVAAPEGKPFGASSPAAKASSPRPTPARSASSRHTAPKGPPVTFTDEVFRAYELSYGGGATLVFTAKAEIGVSDAGTPAEKYVTIVAQPDFDGVPQVRLQSVTDKKDLDITPRMRLVDAVDTRGDGRADLLFELRRSSDRQFAIYRVRGSRAEQEFATESLPVGQPNHASSPDETQSN